MKAVMSISLDKLQQALMFVSARKEYLTNFPPLGYLPDRLEREDHVEVLTTIRAVLKKAIEEVQIQPCKKCGNMPSKIEMATNIGSDVVTTDIFYACVKCNITKEDLAIKKWNNKQS